MSRRNATGSASDSGPAMLSPTTTDVTGAAEDGPSPQELAEIEREWPLIEAEKDLVSAEIRVLTADPRPTELDWRRLRRAEDRVAREAKALSVRSARSRFTRRAA